MRETEQTSLYSDLEKKSALEIVKAINTEDAKIATIVEEQLPTIAQFVELALPKLKAGGRIFYLGAGTSGRLGILDASECPPTFGVSHDVVIGLIAGGDSAIRMAVERAEDNFDGAWEDMQPYEPSALDVVVGIAASGRTPYVIGGLRDAQKHGLLTASISCVSKSEIDEHADVCINVVTGPEVVTGSTRMKAGTAQKMILNMMSTALMIGLGKVEGNRMVDMQLSNEKLVDRGIRMLMEKGLNEASAAKYLKKYGSVRAAYSAFAAEKSA